MSTRFEVHAPQRLEDRNLLALRGVVLDGMPRVGMSARLEEPEGAVFDEPVHGIEFLAADAAGGAGPALTFEYSDERQLERWEEVSWEGAVLRLDPPA